MVNSSYISSVLISKLNNLYIKLRKLQRNSKDKSSTNKNITPACKLFTLQRKYFGFVAETFFFFFAFYIVYLFLPGTNLCPSSRQPCTFCSDISSTSWASEWPRNIYRPRSSSPGSSCLWRTKPLGSEELQKKEREENNAWSLFIVSAEV